MHTWAEDAISGKSEAGVTALLAASRISDSNELEFAASGGFYAFWQLVVWAVYDTGGRVTLMELASDWQKDSHSHNKRAICSGISAAKR